MNRRDFIKVLGLGTLAVVVPDMIVETQEIQDSATVRVSNKAEAAFFTADYSVSYSSAEKLILDIK